VMDGRRLVLPGLARRFVEEGGFDSGDDLAAGLVLFFLTALGPTLRPPPARVETAQEVRRAFGAKHLRYGELMARQEFDPTDLLESALARGGGFGGLLRSLRNDTLEGYILRSGKLDDPDGGNLLRRYFLGAYLGPALFDEMVGGPPESLCGSGFIYEEAPLARPGRVAALGDRASLALVTLRTALEARVALEVLELTESFEVVVGCAGSQTPSDDHLSRSRLLRGAVEGHAQTGDPASEVVVLSADPMMLACAVEVGHKAVGFCRRRELRKKLTEAGALAIIAHLETLERVWASPVSADTP